jgi:hypothetical protein
LVRIQNLALSVALDITSRHGTFSVHRELERAGLVIVGVKFDFFEIEDDLDHVFNNAR